MIGEHSSNSPNGPPLYHFKTLIPVVGGLMLLQGCAEVVRAFLALKTGEWPQRLHDVEETEKIILEQAEAAQKGDKIKVLTRVASYDEKRIHLWSEVVREDGVVAFTAEHIFLHVDTNTGKSSPMGSEMMTKLKPIGDAHAKLPQPVGIGRRVGEKPAK
jgi:hypothetical protein